MGLIKTAIMTGGGMYAVNKIVKTVERRPCSSNNDRKNYPRDNPYPLQGYYGPPPLPLQVPSQNRGAWDEAHGEYQDHDQGQRDYDPKRDYHPKRDFYPGNGDGMSGAKTGGYSLPVTGDYEDRYLQHPDYPYQPAYTRQADSPPSYSPRAQGYIQPRSHTQMRIQGYEQPRGQQSPGLLRDLVTGVAMDIVGHRKAGKSGKKDRGSKGGEMLSEFFR